jgi:putative ATP-binding cassette transporter
LCLAFARMLIQSPRWILIDGSFGSLDDDVTERVFDILRQELKDAGLIHIGGAAEAHDPLYARVLHLVKSQGRQWQDSGEPS